MALTSAALTHEPKIFSLSWIRWLSVACHPKAISWRRESITPHSWKSIGNLLMWHNFTFSNRKKRSKGCSWHQEPQGDIVMTAVRSEACCNQTDYRHPHMETFLYHFVLCLSRMTGLKMHIPCLTTHSSWLRLRNVILLDFKRNRRWRAQNEGGRWIRELTRQEAQGQGGGN